MFFYVFRLAILSQFVLFWGFFPFPFTFYTTFSFLDNLECGSVGEEEKNKITPKEKKILSEEKRPRKEL